MKDGRVLVVDDEPMVRETLGHFLKDEGYVVDLAVDGETALECVRAARPDAILLDLMMPNMNGRQFLQALRNLPEYATVPVLLMTAVHGLNVNLATLGASEIVEKPFNVEELLNKVALAVYRSQTDSGIGGGSEITGSQQALPASAPSLEPGDRLPQRTDRGVVVVIEHDRGKLQQLDLVLSQRGFTVVSMTRALVQLSRLARALRPAAMLLESSEGIDDIVRQLRAEPELDAIPLLVFTREGGGSSEFPDVHAQATDVDLVAFVERRR